MDGNVVMRELSKKKKKRLEKCNFNNKSTMTFVSYYAHVDVDCRQCDMIGNDEMYLKIRSRSIL